MPRSGVLWPMPACHSGHWKPNHASAKEHDHPINPGRPDPQTAGAPGFSPNAFISAQARTLTQTGRERGES
ncbi:MAG: hypothetical protein IH588_10140, partial [Anaerolineales bacterium]|nr:hypothetical protein [Anaerolineales bacterium]